MKDVSDINSEIADRLISCIAIMQGYSKGIWSIEDRNDAGLWIIRNFGKDFNIKSFYEKFGESVINSRVALKIVDRVSELSVINEIMEINQDKKCFKCQDRHTVYAQEFFIGKRVDSKKDWSSTVGSIFASALTIPLFGRIKINSPSTSYSYKTIKLHLMLCERCKQMLNSRWGVKISKEDLKKHDAYQKCVKIGYTDLFFPNELEK